MLYWDSLRPKNILDVFNQDSPSIGEISKEFGEMGINALMVKWMNSFLRFYSTNGSMDAIQVSDTIMLIRETYPHYTQEDFKLFFNMSKKGMFGQVFGRVDGEVIMNWLSKYDVHRDTVAQNESIKEQERFKVLCKVEQSDYTPYSEYLKLKERAERGDKEAQKQLLPP